MVLDAVLWGLVVLAAGALAALVARKLPALKAVDTKALTALAQRDVKRSLVAGRIKRRLVGWARLLKAKLAPLERWRLGLVERVQVFEERALAELARRRTREVGPRELFERGQRALEAGDTAAAEHAFLEVVRHEPRHLQAYAGLAELYLSQRDYEPAAELYRFLVRRADTAALYLGLARAAAGQGDLAVAKAAYGESLAREDGVAPRLEFARVLQELGDAVQAYEQVAAARALEPANPKILDFFIELSIVNGRAIEAQEALDRLREVNPDNQKIPELAQAVRALAAKLKLKLGPKRQPAARAASFGLPVRGRG